MLLFLLMSLINYFLKISIFLYFSDFFKFLFFYFYFSAFLIFILVFIIYFYCVNIFVETHERLIARLFYNKTKQHMLFLLKIITCWFFLFFRFLSIHINLRVPWLIDSWFNFTVEQVIRPRAMTLTRRRIVFCSVDTFRYV